MRLPHATDRVLAWRPAVPGISEVFHARFADHAYPAHAHGTWTLFIVDDGAIRYDLDRHPHGSDRSMVGLLPPHVVHDGRPATSHGYRKRVLYLDSDLFGEHLIGPTVDRPTIPDPSLYGRLSIVHELLACADDTFQAESQLGFVIERLRAILNDRPDDHEPPHPSVLAEQLRALLDAHLLDALTLAAAARLLRASPAHLVRSFTKTFGLAPHAYRLGRRIEIARQRLIEGQPPADVALSVGFYDQSHFTRHFRRFVGATPGQFAARPRKLATGG